MSTVEVKMFTLVCDGCGVDINEDTEYVAWRDAQTSREIADANGWLTTETPERVAARGPSIAGKDWCPDCIEWDEDGLQQRPAALPAQRALLLKERA